MAVLEICSSNYVVNVDNLTNELHEEIKLMHKDRLIPHLQSCLKETIQTALGSFLRRAFIEQRHFTN